jgi:hypothetical protein
MITKLLRLCSRDNCKSLSSCYTHQVLSEPVVECPDECHRIEEVKWNLVREFRLLWWG